jgi:hypothetical protein
VNLIETQVAPVAAVVVPDAALQANALSRIMGLDAALSGFDASAPLRLCSSEALQHPARLPLCRTLARQLLAASGDLLEATLMQRLADRVGVPPEQQAHGDVEGGVGEVRPERAGCRWIRLRIDAPDE